jgi:glutamate dehydrogenase
LSDAAAYRSWFYGYFPEILQRRFAATLDKHPLRREITATVLANEVINRVGPAFIYEITQTCGVTDVEVTKAFFLASEILDLKKLWSQIDSMDNLIIADVQSQVLLELNQSLEQVVLWFLRHSEVKPTSFTSLHNLSQQMPEKLHGDQQHIFQLRNQAFIQMGISSEISHNLGLIPFLPALLDIMYLGKKHHNSNGVAQTYFSLRSKMGLDWLTMQAAQIHADTEWQRSARTILIDDLAQLQVKLTNRVIVESGDNNVDDWLQKNSVQIHHIHPILANIKSSGHSDLGMLSYAMRQLERLV